MHRSARGRRCNSFGLHSTCTICGSVHRWRKTKATGDMIVVRFADDSAPRRREEEVKHVSTNFSSLAA